MPFDHGNPVLFQFQNGTIKSERINERCFARAVFQFQNGTIKRKSQFLDKPTKLHFNSKMVRLRVLALGLVDFALLISIPKWYD